MADLDDSSNLCPLCEVEPLPEFSDMCKLCAKDGLMAQFKERQQEWMEKQNDRRHQVFLNRQSYSKTVKSWKELKQDPVCYVCEGEIPPLGKTRQSTYIYCSNGSRDVCSSCFVLCAQRH